MIRRTSLLIVTLLAAACGPLYSPPDVRVDAVRVGSLGITGGTLLVDLAIANPNRFALSSDAVRYRLDIADPRATGDTIWVEFAEGSFEEAFSVAARDSATVRIPVEFRYQTLGGATTSVLRTGSLTYRAAGEADVRTPVGRRTVPFRHRGTVALTDAR